MNGQSGDFFLRAGQIKSAVAFSGHAVGFALPLVTSSAMGNASYVQELDFEGLIRGFRPFEEKYNIELQDHRSVELGDQEIFVIIGPDYLPTCGTKAELSAWVNSWIEDVESSFVRMSLARFCDDEEVLLSSAQKLIREKQKSLGGRRYAASWFVNSIIYKDIFSQLYGYSSKVGKVDLRSISEGIQFKVHKDWIEVELPREFSDLEKNESFEYQNKIDDALGLVELATGYTVEIKRYRGFSGKPQYSRPAHIDERVLRLLSKVSRATRQEDRVAEILYHLINDGRVGWELIDRYIGKAQFEIDTLAFVKRGLSPGGQGREATEYAIARMLPTIVGQSYPMQRGRMLLALAKQLGANKMLASVIRSMTDHSRAQAVERFRVQIHEQLGRA